MKQIFTIDFLPKWRRKDYQKDNKPPYTNEEGGCAYCGYNSKDDEKLSIDLKKSKQEMVKIMHEVMDEDLNCGFLYGEESRKHAFSLVAQRIIKYLKLK